MTIFWSLSVFASVLALTLVPVFFLGGGRECCALLIRHPVLLLVVAGTWSALGSWTLRRAAELVLLRRSGAKLDADA